MYVRSDSKAFGALIHDVFADDASKQEVDDEGSFQYKLERQIKKELERSNLKLVPNQLGKVLQLNEALSQRMGVVLVGPSQCGKSTLCEMLYKSLQSLGREIEIHVVNPKACDRQQLLGYMDHDTREWYDGILTRAARQSVANGPETTTWIICDGDIDPEWIESLNSVLDDNHLMSLPNGERIQFGSNVNFIFETHDLSFASPATISRMGMIYLAQQDIQLDSLIHSWTLKYCPSEYRNTVQSWMQDIFLKAVSWIDRNIISNPNIPSSLSFVVPTTVIGMVSNALSQMVGVTNNKNDFLVRCIHGLTSNFPPKIASKIAIKVAHLCSITVPKENPSLLHWIAKTDVIASHGDHDDVEADIWRSDTFSIKCPPLIRTKEVCRNLSVIARWLQTQHPFIVAGPDGCGKSQLLREAFHQYVPDAAVACIDCNAYTKSKQIIRKLYQTCSSFSSNIGKVLRPNGSESLILYLKHINLARPDDYNTSQIIELLQQLITYKGFYDESLEFVHLEHIQLVFSMNQGSDIGHHPLSTRFTARVGIIAVQEPDARALSVIYSKYCGIISSLCALDANQSESLHRGCGAMIKMYHDMKRAFRRDEYSHFILTLRDLTRWCFGLTRYSLSSVGVVEIWHQECTRLFADRMPDQRNLDKFNSMLRSSMQKYKLTLPPSKCCSLYCSFVCDTPTDEEDVDNDSKQSDQKMKCFQEIGARFTGVSVDDFRAVITSRVRLYEKEHNELDLILFDEFLQNLQKVDRSLSNGFDHNIVLIGSSGIGRKLLCKLLCYIHRMDCHILSVSQAYRGSTHFASTLRDILKRTGVDGERILLFVEDSQLVDDVMLEYLNQLITSADIIGLFEEKELETLLAPIKEEYRQNELTQHGSLYDYFVRRVASNLSVALSLDEGGKQFVRLCQTNPSVIAQSNVIWMGTQWTTRSMRQYAESRLQRVLSHCGEDQERDMLFSHIEALHEECTVHGACPRSLTVMISIFEAIFEGKVKRNQELRGHLLSGLQKVEYLGIESNLKRI